MGSAGQSSPNMTRASSVLLLELKRVRAYTMAVADLSSTGAFIDTTGERKKGRKCHILVESCVDREEEELEALVFGRLKPAQVLSEGGEYSSEEVSTSLVIVTDKV